MKFIQSSLIALVAATGFLALPAVEAKAETRFHLNWMPPGFPPPPPRRHYYYYPDNYEDDYYWDEEYDEEVYYYPYYEYEDEPAPRYQRPQRKKATASTAPDEIEPAPQVQPKKKPSAKPTAKPKATSTTASVSCDKAKSILAGYGFGEVATESCSGKVYSFSAKRGGKSFAVKVSALNGELTEVKRQ